MTRHVLRCGIVDEVARGRRLGVMPGRRLLCVLGRKAVVPMVDWYKAARIAMRCDTVVARAFRVALGLPASISPQHDCMRGRRERGKAPHHGGRYDHMAECFENRTHVNF